MEHYKTWKFIITYKNGKEIMTFGDIEIEKQKCHYHKDSILICNVDINEI